MPGNSATQQPPTPNKPRPLTRVLRSTLLVIVGTYAGLVVAMMFLENSLIYFPARYPDGDWTLPDDTVEDAWFTAADGTKLHGWYAPHPDPHAVILFAHGNAGHLADRAPLIDTYRDRLGCTVMLFDYRGYGRSEGSPHEAGLIADARAARAWLAARAAVPEADVVLVGRSIGGAVMCQIAPEAARALVVESSFSSLADVASHHYRWLPVRLFMRTRFDSATAIQNYHGPLLVSHGTGDTIVPFEYGQRLFTAATGRGSPAGHGPENTARQFVELPGLDHNHPQPGTYYDALARFLANLPPTNK